jgi:hypothetical protein
MDERVLRMNYIELTRAFGLTSLILSVGILFHLNHYETMARKMVDGPAGFIMGGVLPVLVGSFIINFPHANIHGWSLTLTIIGWILFLAGVFRIWCVHWWSKIIHAYMGFVPVLFATFGLIFALLLCYAGFIAPLYHS